MFDHKNAQKIILASTIVFQAVGYPCGYTQLYRAGTRTTVDVLYDLHVEERGISLDQLDRVSASYQAFKKRLFESEKQVLHALERLNVTAEPQSIDLIWECYAAYRPGAPEFISYGKAIKSFFKNLHFIYGDTCRDNGFCGLFKVKFDGEVIQFPNRAGSTFESPVPLSADRIKKIVLNSGQVTWLNFKHYYEETMKKARDHFKPFQKHVIDYERLFDNNEHYDALADVEILSNILASDKKRIIVYIGGWHSASIVPFLKANGFNENFTHKTFHGDFPRSYNALCHYDELTTSQLSPLSQIV